MGDKFFLDREDTLLIVIDFQEKLTAKMKHREKIMDNIKRLIKASKILDLPLILTEQYPKGIGPTEKEVIDELPEYRPLEKIYCSCYRDEGFFGELSKAGRKSLLLCGIETHVCVLQTALDSIKGGYNVHVVSDAVGSREKFNWKTGIELMRDAGAVITSTEIVLFQLLKKSGTKEFKEMLKHIK